MQETRTDMLVILHEKPFFFLNGSQLAEMKKYIPRMSLPWNL